MGHSAIITEQIRPNRLEGKKDEEYHRKYARWILGSVSNSAHNLFMTKSSVNWAFYKGNQWIFNEDLQGFLMDESGDSRNRIKFVENLIRPMVEQYVGNAIRLDLNMDVIAISEFAANRREMELARLKILASEAARSEVLGDEMRAALPIGETEEETEEIFENTYVDDFSDVINLLVDNVMEENDFEDKKIILSKHLALDGIGVLYGTEYNGEYLWEVIDPRYFIFDHSAKRPDLKDAEYMGMYHEMIPSTIYERWQDVSLEDKKAIEKFTETPGSINSGSYSSYGGFDISGGRAPVYEMFWRDTEQQEWGYVMDEFGYEFFTRIGDDEDSKFKKKDLIIPEEDGHKKILKGKKSRKIFVDVLRYTVFIPGEIMPTKGSKDIVLESGRVPYTESSISNPSNVEFPFKCYCWAYNNGDILSPVDDAIAPQRYLNRIQSIVESHINNSRGSGTIIDGDMVDAQGGEEEILRSMNLSKPIFVKAKGNLNNSLGSYDSTIGSGVVSMYEAAAQTRQSIQNITGVNESMQGTAGGKRRLVGVTQLDIQRGTLIQEPFYYALSRIILQAGQAIASVGKRIYADNRRKLAIMTGDKGVRNIVITDEMVIEDFRMYIKRTVGIEEQKQAGNQLLFTLVGAQLIDRKRFANMLNRGNIDDIARAVREHQQELAEAEKIQSQQQQGQAVQDANQIAGQTELDQTVKDADAERDERREDAKMVRDIEKDRNKQINKATFK